LTLHLQLEDSERGGLRSTPETVNLRQAGQARPGARSFLLVLEAVHVAQDGTFLQLDFGFSEVGFGLPDIERALFSLAPVLRFLLPDLLGEVLVLRFRLARRIHLRGAVKFRKHIAFLHLRSVRGEANERETRLWALRLSFDSRGLNAEGANGLNGSGGSNRARSGFRPERPGGRRAGSADAHRLIPAASAEREQENYESRCSSVFHSGSSNG
jgi:hypothetical protein